MTIKSIEIQNFRSITKLVLSTEKIDEKVCSILLGKNESGKSNILKSISLLDKERPIDYNIDCNKEAKKTNEPISLIFTLDFNKSWWETHIKSKNTPEELIDSTNVRNDYFYVYLAESEKFNDYVLSSAAKIEKIITIYTGNEKITKDNISEVIPTYTLLTKSKLEEIIETNFDSAFDNNTPKIIFWEPSNKYLINEPIDLNAFKVDTKISIPLRNIFHIAGIDDDNIKKRIELIEKNDEERMELSETLSEEITKYINAVWTEHKISIKLTIDQNLACIVNIEDKDNHRPKYKMEQRSDGFKQFISILLNLSAENAASTLKNRLILLDEPEVHLHPSGIRYLRDELLKISKNNNLIISTHSVYMIDKLNLNRHFSVSKEKSVTLINQIEDNNPYEEEVIYESLGTSIFEHISPTMLIFEGKTDKDIFDLFSNKFRTELITKNISSISTNGVESMPKYVKFFTGELVKGYIVVDSDKAGRAIKKQIITENDTFNIYNTFEISDLITMQKATMTLEDLFPKDVIETCLLTDFSLTIKLEQVSSYIDQIKTAYKTINEKDLKLSIMQFIINDVNKKAMTKEKTKEKYSLYYEFIGNLYKKIHS
jgi:predicted ATP-dependent endonuclease of OLD family